MTRRLMSDSSLCTPHPLPAGAAMSSCVIYRGGSGLYISSSWDRVGAVERVLVFEVVYSQVFYSGRRGEHGLCQEHSPAGCDRLIARLFPSFFSVSVFSLFIFLLSLSFVSSLL